MEERKYNLVTLLWGKARNVNCEGVRRPKDEDEEGRVERLESRTNCFSSDQVFLVAATAAEAGLRLVMGSVVSILNSISNVC